GTYPFGTYEGELLLKNQVLELHSPADALEQGVGIVPQEINVIDQLNVAENIVVGQWTGGNGNGRSRLVNMRRIKKQVAQFLHEFGITLDPGETVVRLTAAQKQLVMIARALYRRPSVLILDEPTSSLALNEINNLFEHLNELRSKGITCVFITHKLVEIFELTDHTTVLRDGEVTGEFEREDYNENDIITAMVGRKIENMFPNRESSPGTEEVLRVENLTIPHPTIANRNVVEDVNFNLYEGEILGLAGLVGSGRSEIVNAIVGRMESTGDIYVNGRQVQIHNPGGAKRVGIGLITEDRKKDGLLPNLEIRSNITVQDMDSFTSFGIINSAKEKTLAQKQIETFNIKTPSVEQMVVNLSGGNQQKVILAKVLMPNPKILLMDEPTRGIDIGAKNEIYKLMLSLVKEGISIIMISSELPELLGMCDRFVVLAEGRVADEFPKSEASEHRVMQAATLARSESIVNEV
ncbi:MAG: ATP-binding cassette domain-containing protein, partial [Aliifodinibius sp.]|nr:sugar ABC transporter ATP-binding protein [candidate division Zixibacteria bacterium]NIT57791.1 sugar ABC transporter ATP-binding protein [Fodinibius sp.]NIW45429.1 ATP-binding cassette domain-containing protein [Gammaproteobacteria bacterium]NIR64616.1 sugar ABC transporter ATP-binding protein [candidate division Zixibacteria bacterium]NIS46476.1 sugar ABC transporter ATP-binding protein [candidate division Zixibacteria bacterium]